MTDATLRHDVEFSLDLGYEICFEYHGHEYWIFYSVDGGNGYTITQTPDIYLYTSKSSDWKEALDQPVIEGKSMNELFDQLEFTDYIHDNRGEFDGK